MTKPTVLVEACVETTTAEGEGRTFSEEEGQAVCECAFDEIAETIPFEDFKRINEEQEEGPSELPGELQEIMSGCVDEHASPT